MGKYVLTNCKIYVDNYDISGDANAGTLDISTPALDSTTFNDAGAKSKICGLDDVKASISVLYDNTTAYTPDDEIDTWRGGMTAKAVTICPTTGVAGEVAYCFKGLGATYSHGGSVGEVKKGTWSIEGAGDTGAIVRGTVSSNVLAGVTGAGNGTSLELGLLGTGKTLYSVLHVYSINGGTLAVTVYSDTATNFPSGISRIVHTPATTTTAEWSMLAGAVADDTWWRIQYTYAGTLVKFVHSMAIV